MADLQNTSSVDTVVTSKAGLVTDLNTSYITKEHYSYARNIVRNSKEGDLGTVGNEPSTVECVTTPNKIVGVIALPDETVLIASGEGANSEIGIGNFKDCSYKTLKKDACLNFSADFPVTGQAKKHFNQGIIATITDKFNPVRRINLDKIKSDTPCEELLLHKLISQPCISLKKGQAGNVPNGMYSVAIAYVVDGQVYSDWYSVTNRIAIHSKNGANSIEVKVEGLDTEFKEFALVLIGNYIDPNTKGATKVAKIIGNYSTRTRVVSISDVVNDDYIDIKLSQLVVRKKTWAKAGIVSSNSQYLILADLVGYAEENYQLKAMGIEVEYVVEQVPADYYEVDGQDVTYYRDENYELSLVGVRNTGEFTEKIHIPGRKAKPSDRAIVSSADVYEYDTQFADCQEPGKIERWQTENTAGAMIPQNNKFACNRRIIGTGSMGYHESTERYPENLATFGEDAGTPIRHIRIPDECIVPRYSVINGVTYINIIGIKLKNIPKFDDPSIIGYKILRSDRKGGNGTVIARGMLTNVRSFTDERRKEVTYYSNYTVNDLSPDQYLSATQTVFKNGKETNFTPLAEYHKDKFNFYSPHTMFEPRYSLGTELKIEAEEIATVKGRFELVHNHPKAKLLNQFSFWLASAVGFLQSTLTLLGKVDVAAKTEFKVTAPPSRTVTVENKLEIDTVEELISLSPGQIIAMVLAAAQATDGGGVLAVLNLIKVGIQSLIALGIKIPYSILSGIIQADQTMDTIYNFTGYTDYVYQYNAVAKFDRSICVPTGNKRRRLLNEAKYIPSDIVTIDGITYNNYFREKTVLLEVNKEIQDPKTKDNTRNTMSGFGVCGASEDTLSTGSAYYATSKAINPNQYGRVGSSMPVSLHSCVLNNWNETPVLYGGDCIITRFQFQKRMQFFNQNMATANFPEGTEYDYRLYGNIGYPRFWMDTSKFDFAGILSKNVMNFAKFNRTTAAKHNLDCKDGKDGGSISRIDNAYMYLSNNCAMDFFVEADYNTAYREETKEPFYSKENTNLSQIFRSDRLNTPEEFKINRVFSDLYTTEIFALQQRDDFDPANPVPVSQPNSVIYSLPSFNLQELDNWQYFLPNNFMNFDESDFGKLTAIHKIDQDRVIYLFSKSSPYMSVGRDILQLDGSGRKITIGDGGLFGQDPREMMPTDNNYGACNSKYAFANTHLGKFFPSERQGRILNADNLDDITRQGISYWCKNYMPIALYKYFSTYPQEENPIGGVGYLTAFDSFYETIYFTKRDFSPKFPEITYENGSFMYLGTKVSLRDPMYFNDISWTLSYSPLDKGFVSYHDWHPDWIIQRDNHFMSVKGNGIWKHNETHESYTTYYGHDYGFDIEQVSSSGQQVEVVRSLEYLLEVYKYKNFGRDRFHVLNENFSNLLVYNTEQISPPLNLVHGNPNPEENLDYPRKSTIDALSFDVTYFKEEQKYRVNQFWDATRDRGEFSREENHLFPTDESGYKSVVNPVAIDVNKPEEERKKFRHYWTKFRLSRETSGPLKFIFKILNIKKLNSPR